MHLEDLNEVSKVPIFFNVFFLGPVSFFNQISRFSIKKQLFGFLGTKACRIIRKLHQKISFRTEMCKIERKHIFSKCIYGTMLFLASRQLVLIVLMCSWVLWPKNDTERIWNYLKKQVLDPKRSKLDQKSLFGVSGGQDFPPKIPPSFTEHRPSYM